MNGENDDVRKRIAAGTLLLVAMTLVYAMLFCCGCVNCYTRCPGTNAKVVNVYQCTRTAAAGSVVVAFPQMMNDCGSFYFDPMNLLTIPLGCVVLADAVCESVFDTLFLPVDYYLHYKRSYE